MYIIWSGPTYKLFVHRKFLFGTLKRLPPLKVINSENVTLRHSIRQNLNFLFHKKSCPVLWEFVTF